MNTFVLEYFISGYSGKRNLSFLWSLIVTRPAPLKEVGGELIYTSQFS